MARNPLQQYVDASAQFSGLTRDRAEKIVKELVKAGEVRRKKASAAVDELVDRSRANAEALVGMIQTEVRNQLAMLETVTKDAVDRLEEQVDALRQQVQDLVPGGVGRLAPSRRAPVRTASTTAAATAAAAAGTGPAKNRPAKKRAAATRAKKATAKKATAKKATAKRAATKRAPAKRAAVKRAPAKQAAARKAAG